MNHKMSETLFFVAKSGSPMDGMGFESLKSPPHKVPPSYKLGHFEEQIVFVTFSYLFIKAD